MTQTAVPELIDIILAANQGRTAAAIALAGNYSADASEKALRTHVREIGHKMALKAQSPEEMDLLLDVIEAGEHDDYLTNPDALLSREAIQEGEEILIHLYGSLGAARAVARRLRRPHGITEQQMERMMTLAATLCVAGLVHRGQTGFMAASSSVGTGSAGATFLRELINAVIKGITYVPPRRRRRRNRATYAKSYKTSLKRKWQRKRSTRTSTPSLADVFGDLIKRAI